MKSFYLGILMLFFLASCNQNQPSKVNHVNRAFYHWKSENSFGETKEHLKALKVKTMYYKFFEVDYSETMGNFPSSKTSFEEYDYKELDSIKIIPTVFVRNEIFQYNTEKSLEQLADNISFLIAKRSKNYNGDPIFNYDEIQIDCDWTKATGDKYFYLLEQIKKKSNKTISCTLRLYPYKYPNIMGIPPVDKVMLMCYNLIKPLSNKDKNSILDIDELKKYLDKSQDYPKHIDVALPVFYWTQLYQNNRFKQLVSVSEATFKSFTKPVKPLWYEITKDTVLDWQIYFRKGDQIKYEEVTKPQIEEAISIIKKNVKLDATTTISIFDLDKKTFNKYSHEEISSFYDSFTK